MFLSTLGTRRTRGKAHVLDNTVTHASSLRSLPHLLGLGQVGFKIAMRNIFPPGKRLIQFRLLEQRAEEPA